MNIKKKIIIDRDNCAGCGLCMQICPHVFDMDDEGKVKIIDPDGDNEKRLQEACDSCPMKAIRLE